MIKQIFISLFIMTHSQVALASESGVPDERPFISDRPGPVDSPKTTLPGTSRIEIAAYAFQHQNNSNSRTHSVGSFYFATGLNESVEVQFGIDGYKFIDDPSNKQRGLGATTLRLKANLVGNDHGDFALGVIPKIIHTGNLGGNNTEVGLGIPVSYAFADSWSFASTPSWETVKGLIETTDLFVLPLYVGKDLSEANTVFSHVTHAVEIGGSRTTTLGLGTTYRPFSNLQIDAEVAVGSYGDSDSSRFSIGTTVQF